MNLEKFFCLALVLLACSVAAQDLSNPDWVEAQVPAPPLFNKNKLIAIEMPSYVSLRFGVDPATLSITADGVVRYVMVAFNTSGTLTAMYEGIRCATGEVRSYARYSADGPWSLSTNSQWRGLSELPSRHALALARQGACDGRAAPASSVAAIVNALTQRSQGGDH